MGAFGDTLRQAREDLGASLGDAERETRIHRRYLQALENEDVSALPAAVYTRGFIRTYCRYLGLNGDAMIDLFGSRPEDDRAEVRPIPAQLSTTRMLSLRPVAVLGFLVMAVLLVAFLWAQYNSFVESLGNVEQIPTSRSVGSPTASSKPVAAASPAVGASPSPQVAVASPSPIATPERGLAIEVRIVERTWLEVWVDGRSVLADTVQAGMTRTFNAEQQIRMRAGNAGGVQVIVNGVSQGALGSRGQAVEASWGR